MSARKGQSYELSFLALLEVVFDSRMFFVRIFFSIPTTRLTFAWKNVKDDANDVILIEFTWRLRYLRRCKVYVASQLYFGYF